MEKDFTQEICELIRITSTDLPSSVERKLRDAAGKEKEGSAAHGAMCTILSNIDMTRKNSTPICQDTGTPIFFVHYPRGMDMTSLTTQIRQATEMATKNSICDRMQYIP